jgi:alpha-L-arabinofuranosidase
MAGQHPEYRWKKMIGPRAQRPLMSGFWTPYPSNGWGIIDFLNFCEAADFFGVPDFNIDETPQDMADFVEYVNGPASSSWGKRRVADGHPAPYRLKCLQLGNENRVDAGFAAKFNALAEVIWAKDKNIILAVGDFSYEKPITDPNNFTGNYSGLTNLEGQKAILQCAKAHNREVWFDVHLGTEDLPSHPTTRNLAGFVDAMEKVADGAKFRVVVFEFNSGIHTIRRALSNAVAINTIACDGRIPVAASANCLQAFGQNDNGWDQGLIFFTSDQVWYQPPALVAQMMAHSYQPQSVPVQTNSAALDIFAARSKDGKTLVLRVVNFTDKPIETAINLGSFTPRQRNAQVEQLAGPLDAENTVDNQQAVKIEHSKWQHSINGAPVPFTFKPYSFTVIRFE